MRRLTLALLAMVVIASPAEARHRHKSGGLHPDCNILMPCEPFANFFTPQPIRIHVKMSRIHVKMSRKRRDVPISNFGAPSPSIEYTVSQALPHPSGCPSRAFCGCGAAVELFGSPIRSLWLAASWFKFPRAEPGYNMAAVRRHHVMVLKKHVRGDVWMVFDANNGHHRTSYHARSIAGYSIRNPQGGIRHASM
jgi:hypothetical protein